MLTIQIIAFYIVSLILMVFSIVFASRKHFRVSGLLIVLSFVSFVFAQFSGDTFSAVIHGLTMEQYLCWGFGFLFLCVAVYFIHEKALAYGFVLTLISVVCCFCGFSSVQSFLKTEMLWMVTDTLKSYGDKIDNYQATVVDIQSRLSARQGELETNQTNLLANLNRQWNELNAIQGKIRQAQTSILGQQSDITNQYYKISLVQSNLALAETNIDAQQKQLSDVQSLVNTLFSNTEYEDLSGSDSNSVAILNKGGYQQVIFKLRKAPVPNTIQGIAYGGDMIGQTPLFPNMFQFVNIVAMKYAQGLNLHDVTFNFRYIADNRQTNLVHTMMVTGTNSVSFDGQQYQLNF
jgi:hypothetical protein